MSTSRFPALQIWTKRQLFSPTLVMVMLLVSLCSFNFGYDTAIFGSIQGMTSFTTEFGTFDHTQGTFRLPSWLSSVMNSVPFLGKLVGCLMSGPLMERYGRKAGLYAICVISIIGSILQTSSFSVAQYTVGRVFCYMGTGIIISVVPTYQSECSPAELRGTITSTLQLCNTIGGILGSVITFATANMTSKAAWVIPTSIQIIAPTLVLIGLYWVPESPRWLLSRDHGVEAAKTMAILRRRGTPMAQIEMELELMMQDEQTRGKGKWSELFKGTNGRRTGIAVGAMFCQQITGQSFGGSYGVIFYQQQKITSPSPFALNVVSSTTSFLTTLLTVLVVDSVGRRPLSLIGSFMMGVWMFVVGAVGSIKNPNAAQKRALVAGLQLFGKAFSLSWAPLSYVIMGEVQCQRLREKTVLVASSISVIATFLVNFTVPYLLNAPYANLGAKVGYIFGSLSMAAMVWTYFFLPELKNRSLEELDAMFEAKVPTRQFRNYETTGVGREITELEGVHVAFSKA